MHGAALVLDRDHPGAHPLGAGLGTEPHPVGPHGDAPVGQRDDVVAADEAGDEGGGRALEHRAGIGRLLDAAAIHHHHEVGQRHRLLLAVGDVHEGDAELGLQPLQLGPHPHPQERIEGRERLVEEQHLRAGDEGAGERDALLLAARELRRQAAGEVVHLHQRQHRLGALEALVLRDAPHLEPEGDVVAAGEVGKQRVALEHHRGAALRRRQVADRLGADHHVARRDGLVPGDHPERRGLAAAGRPEQAAIRAGPDLQVDPIDRDGVAVALGQADQFDVHALSPRRLSLREGKARGGPGGGERAWRALRRRPSIPARAPVAMRRAIRYPPARLRRTTHHPVTGGTGGADGPL